MQHQITAGSYPTLLHYIKNTLREVQVSRAHASSGVLTPVFQMLLYKTCYLLSIQKATATFELIYDIEKLHLFHLKLFYFFETLAFYGFLNSFVGCNQQLILVFHGNPVRNGVWLDDIVGTRIMGSALLKRLRNMAVNASHLKAEVGTGW